MLVFERQLVVLPYAENNRKSYMIDLWSLNEVNPSLLKSSNREHTSFKIQEGNSQEDGPSEKDDDEPLSDRKAIVNVKDMVSSPLQNTRKQRHTHTHAKNRQANHTARATSHFQQC